jgi:hypothetical protein
MCRRLRYRAGRPRGGNDVEPAEDRAPVGLSTPQDRPGVLGARETFEILVSLSERQRADLTLLVASASYVEIAEMTAGRTTPTSSRGGAVIAGWERGFIDDDMSSMGLRP